MRCYDCHKHKWNTNHVEAKYREFERMLRSSMEEKFGNKFYLAVNTQEKLWKMGCFDIFYPGNSTVFSK